MVLTLESILFVLLEHLGLTFCCNERSCCLFTGVGARCHGGASDERFVGLCLSGNSHENLTHSLRGKRHACSLTLPGPKNMSSALHVDGRNLW